MAESVALYRIRCTGALPPLSVRYPLAWAAVAVEGRDSARAVREGAQPGHVELFQEGDGHAGVGVAEDPAFRKVNAQPMSSDRVVRNSLGTGACDDAIRPGRAHPEQI